MSFPPNPLPEAEAPSAAKPVVPMPREPVWTGWDVALIVIAFLVSFFILTSLMLVALRVFGRVPQPESPLAIKVVLFSQAFAYGVVLLAMRAIMRRLYKRDMRDAVRWNWPRGQRWTVYAALGVGIQLVAQLVLSRLPIPRRMPIDRFFQDVTSAYMMLAIGITLAPLVEELFFRGFLYPVLARRFGVGAGAALTAAGFALLHAPQLANAWGPVLILFLVGLAFTIVRIVNGSVAASFVVHAAYNASLLGFVYIATDRFRHLERLVRQ